MDNFNMDSERVRAQAGKLRAIVLRENGNKPLPVSAINIKYY